MIQQSSNQEFRFELLALCSVRRRYLERRMVDSGSAQIQLAEKYHDINNRDANELRLVHSVNNLRFLLLLRDALSIGRACTSETSGHRRSLR